MSVCSFIPFGIENPPKFKTISEQTVDRNSAVELLLGYNSVNGYVWNKLFKRQLIDEHNLRFQDGYWYVMMFYLLEATCITVKT